MESSVKLLMAIHSLCVELMFNELIFNYLYRSVVKIIVDGKERAFFQLFQFPNFKAKKSQKKTKILHLYCPCHQLDKTKKNRNFQKYRLI